MKIELKTITWQETIGIRHRVLWPNKNPEFCHVSGDEEGIHFGAYVDNELISVASVYFTEESARLRKFATYEQFQGMGVGTSLLTFVLTAINAKGCKYFWCDARESAIGFYERFKMKKMGDRFFKSGVPYFKMGISLQ